MKRSLVFLLLCAVTFGLAAQENKSKEIVKKGWNFGPLPVVGWDSDLGFQYGACVDIFNYGDGSRYPSYNYKINLEAAKEIAFQLRLRNLSGIIVVDFINMKSKEKNAILLQELSSYCKNEL